MEEDMLQPAAVPRFWDFRTILDVHPESKRDCVAYNKINKRRCKHLHGENNSNLQDAGLLLDRMDGTRSLSQCREQLGELARLTVCGTSHQKHPKYKADCCKRWNQKILEYVAAEERTALAQASAFTIDTGSTTQTIAVELSSEAAVQMTTSTTTESTQTQQYAQRHLSSPASERLKLRGNVDDTPINENEIVPRTRPQPQGPILERQDDNAVSQLLDDTSSDVFDSGMSAGFGSFTNTASSAQNYGLPSPPNSILDSNSFNQPANILTQSPPPTPTRVPVLINDANVDSPRLMEASISLTDTAKDSNFTTTDTNDTQSSAQTSKILMRSHQAEDHPTAESNLEPDEISRPLPVTIQKTTATSDAQDPSKGPVEDRSHSLNEALVTEEVMAEPLQPENKEDPQSMEQGSSSRLRTPIRTRCSHVEAPPTPEATPESSQTSEILICIRAEENPSGVKITLTNISGPISKEEEGNKRTFRASFESSRACEIEVNCVNGRDSATVQTPPQSPLPRGDDASTKETDSVTHEAMPESSKSNEHIIPTIEISSIPNGEIPSQLEPEPKAPSIHAEQESEADQTQSITLEQRTEIIQAATIYSNITTEPIDDSPPTRVGSFGHAIIDPSERRYKTRFSERQEQERTLPSSQTHEGSLGFIEEHLFSNTATSEIHTHHIQQQAHPQYISTSTQVPRFSLDELHIPRKSINPIPKVSADLPIVKEGYITTTTTELPWEVDNNDDNGGIHSKDKKTSKKWMKHIKDECKSGFDTVKRRSERFVRL